MDVSLSSIHNGSLYQQALPRNDKRGPQYLVRSECVETLFGHNKRSTYVMLGAYIQEQRLALLRCYAAIGIIANAKVLRWRLI